MKLRFRFLGLIIPILLLISSCLQQPSEVADSNNIVIYPAPPAKTRIQYLTSFSSSSEFKRKQSSFNKFLFGEENPLPIVKPYGISLEASKIYICDTGINGLVILDMENGSFEYFIPKGKGQLQLPLNCDVDNNGNIYIADGNRKQVVIFDSQLNYLNAITMQGGSKPTDVFVDDTRIWISAIDNHKLYTYDRSDLTFKSVFPRGEIEDDGYLYQPSNFTISDNKVLVSDLGDCSVKIFDEDYNFVNSFGSPGKNYGQFTRPKGITADRDGNIYVVDAAFENVQIFNPKGELLLFFGGTYSGPGGMWLPADVTIDYNNLEYFEQYVDPSFKLEYLIFVTNQYGPDKVSVYGFVGLTE